MSVDYGAVLTTVYNTFGADATLTPVNGSPVVLNVIDQTSGVEITSDNTGVQTILPAACVRVSTLATVGLSRANLKKASLLMSGKGWRVEYTVPKPGLVGETDGEVLMILSEAPIPVTPPPPDPDPPALPEGQAYITHQDAYLVHPDGTYVVAEFING